MEGRPGRVGEGRGEGNSRRGEFNSVGSPNPVTNKDATDIDGVETQIET